MEVDPPLSILVFKSKSFGNHVFLNILPTFTYGIFYESLLLGWWW